MVVEAEIFPGVLPNLKDPDEYVKKNVATLVREVCKHTQELAQLIVNSGGECLVVAFLGIDVFVVGFVVVSCVWVVLCITW